MTMKRSNLKSVFKKALQFTGILSLMLLIGFGCTETNMTGPEDGPEEGKARMNIHLTDAPGDYQEVNVNVQGLRVHYTPFEMDTAETDPMNGGEWIEMPVDTTMVDLLELQNGVDTLLASADLEPGYYRELRLMLGDGNNVVVDSTTHSLKVPSGQSSGYKIKFDAELVEGQVLDVTIDFDAHESVHKAGNSGKYILRPVLRAMVEGVDTVQTGSVTGIIEPMEANPSIYALMEGDTLATTQTDTSGSFLLEELNEGIYELRIDAANESYQDTTVSEVSVSAGSQTDVGTITLNESE